jgi:small subunit ribosomal protein S13
MGGSGKKVKDVDKQKEAEAKPDEKKEKPKRIDKPVQQYSLVRVSGTDLNGDKPIGRAILGIKGISWAISNAICLVGGIDANRKLKDFSEAEIAKVEQIIKDPVKYGVPIFLINRNRDMDTGNNVHLTGSDLDVARKFDIQRYIDLKTYRGWRHMLGQPVRGQRTRSKFRQKGRVVGVLRKEIKIATGATAAPAAGGAAPAAAPAKKEEKK